MNDLSGRKDYIDPKVVNLITQIGYKHRVGNYYVITEEDGYINISYASYNNFENIIFHKNFYSNTYDDNGFHKKDISEIFDNFLDFKKFISKYHIKEMRKIKIMNLYDKI